MYQPLGDKILVEIIVEERKTEAGIILDTVKTPFDKVKVLCVSPDTETVLKEGDICLSEKGGVELEPNVWLKNEKSLVCKL